MDHWPEGVSVVMIARNEAHFLARTLPPLQHVADEIIFVDTGSHDDSVALATTFGCRIFQQPWEEDFSAPKNFAIEQARFSWILNVDCDEVLMDALQARDKILTAGRGQSFVPGFILHMDNLMANGDSLSSQALRLFRNDTRIRFSNPVHEGVADALFQHWPHCPPQTLDITLQHYGYQAGANKQKLGRNLAILRKWVEREPNTIYGCFKLGMNLHHRGNCREGLFFLERAFSLLSQTANKKSYPFLEDLVISYYQSLRENGLKEKALNVQKQIMTWQD